MNIQQDYQNQQSQQYQQDTFPCNPKPDSIFKDISSLDALTEYAITALTEKTPSYFHEYEKTFTKELHGFTDEVIRTCRRSSNETAGTIVEILGCDLLDASCTLNQEHFKAGLQFGALMMVQLLI